jgi:hypothetical protein
MYVWLWRRLPGTAAVKAVQCLVLFCAVAAVLLFVVFPWLEPRLWFTHVTVSS